MPPISKTRQAEQAGLLLLWNHPSVAHHIAHTLPIGNARPFSVPAVPCPLSNSPLPGVANWSVSSSMVMCVLCCYSFSKCECRHLVCDAFPNSLPRPHLFQIPAWVLLQTWGFPLLLLNYRHDFPFVHPIKLWIGTIFKHLWIYNSRKHTAWDESNPMTRFVKKETDIICFGIFLLFPSNIRNTKTCM